MGQKNRDGRLIHRSLERHTWLSVLLMGHVGGQQCMQKENNCKFCFLFFFSREQPKTYRHPFSTFSLRYVVCHLTITSKRCVAYILIPKEAVKRKWQYFTRRCQTKNVESAAKHLKKYEIESWSHQMILPLWAIKKESKNSNSQMEMRRTIIFF